MAQQQKSGFWSFMVSLLGSLKECRVMLNKNQIPFINIDLFQLILIPAHLNFKKK